MYDYQQAIYNFRDYLCESVLILYTRDIVLRYRWIYLYLYMIMRDVNYG